MVKENTIGTGHGLKGDELEEELQKAEQELGINTSAKDSKDQLSIANETASKESLKKKKTKSPEEIAEKEALKQKSIKEIKDKILEISPDTEPKSIPNVDEKATIDKNIPENKLERMGEIESRIKNIANNLIEGAKNEEDKKVFTEILEKINKVKSNLMQERVVFEERMHTHGSLRTMQKFFNNRKGMNMLPGSTDRGLSMEFMKGFDDNDAYLTGTTIVDLNKVTKEQMGQILQAFDFWKVNKLSTQPNKNIIFQAYNNDRKFWKKKAEQGSDHKFTIKSGTPGVVLKSHGDMKYGDFMRISLGKEFADEVLSLDIVV